MSHGRRWIDFQDMLVPHTDTDGLPRIQATGVNTDLSTRKEPAHGQRFDSSLAVPNICFMLLFGSSLGLSIVHLRL